MGNIRLPKLITAITVGHRAVQIERDRARRAIAAYLCHIRILIQIHIGLE